MTTNCFSQPANLQFGNLSPNVIRSRQLFLDVSVFRQIAIAEKLKLQIRGEGFTVVNTPQWNNPDSNIGNQTFGYITSAGGNRQPQLGARLIW